MMCMALPPCRCSSYRVAGPRLVFSSCVVVRRLGAMVRCNLCGGGVGRQGTEAASFQRHRDCRRWCLRLERPMEACPAHLWRAPCGAEHSTFQATCVCGALASRERVIKLAQSIDSTSHEGGTPKSPSTEVDRAASAFSCPCGSASLPKHPNACRNLAAAAGRLVARPAPVSNSGGARWRQRSSAAYHCGAAAARLVRAWQGASGGHGSRPLWFTAQLAGGALSSPLVAFSGAFF